MTTNVKTKEILKIKVTVDEHVHDSKELSELVDDDIIKPDRKLTIGKIFADGAHDNNDL
jgi:hypothetical protein